MPPGIGGRTGRGGRKGCGLKRGAVAAEPWEGLDQALVTHDAKSAVAAADKIKFGLECLVAVGAGEWFCRRP